MHLLGAAECDASSCVFVYCNIAILQYCWVGGSVHEGATQRTSLLRNTAVLVLS
jgi:hypothetical protein